MTAVVPRYPNLLECEIYKVYAIYRQESVCVSECRVALLLDGDWVLVHLLQLPSHVAA